jgi:hypothetical protein
VYGTVRVTRGYFTDDPFFICDFCGFDVLLNEGVNVEYSNRFRVDIPVPDDESDTGRGQQQQRVYRINLGPIRTIGNCSDHYLIGYQQLDRWEELNPREALSPHLRRMQRNPTRTECKGSGHKFNLDMDPDNHFSDYSSSGTVLPIWHGIDTAWRTVLGAWHTVHSARCTVHGSRCTVHGCNAVTMRA